MEIKIVFLYFDVFSWLGQKVQTCNYMNYVNLEYKLL
jgi:hypothetical protein